MPGAATRVRQPVRPCLSLASSPASSHRPRSVRARGSGACERASRPTLSSAGQHASSVLVPTRESHSACAQRPRSAIKSAQAPVPAAPRLLRAPAGITRALTLRTGRHPYRPGAAPRRCRDLPTCTGRTSGSRSAARVCLARTGRPADDQRGTHICISQPSDPAPARAAAPVHCRRCCGPAAKPQEDLSRGAPTAQWIPCHVVACPT